MKLYHGTTEAVACRALRDGLLPRIAHGRSNWGHGITTESNPSLVYMTSVYAPYFGLQAIDCADIKAGFKIGIVEIETDMLQERWMRPDEDFIEQVTRNENDTKRLGIKGVGMAERTKWVRNHIDQFSGMWKLSVEHLGNCAHKGQLPAHAITRVSICQISASTLMLIAARDPAITWVNKKFCGDKYAMITRWCMGESVTLDEWLKLNHQEHMREQMPNEAVKWHEEQLNKNQTCVEILKP